MQPLTPALIGALTRQETGEIPIMLVTVEHADLAAPARFSSVAVTRHSDTPLVYKAVSRLEDYYFVPMQIRLPDSRRDAPPTAAIRISNVGRELIAALRSIATPAAVTLELVLQSDPDTVAIAFPVLDLAEAAYDRDFIDITLGIDAFATEPFPAGAFTPGAFPGLFG